MFLLTVYFVCVVASYSVFADCVFVWLRVTVFLLTVYLCGSELQCFC